MFGFVAYLFNSVASDTHSTLSIAQRATDPKAEQKQLTGFLNLETLIFRLDCDAKAHQLTAIDNDLGGHLQLSGLQASCTEIQAPSITLPTR